MSKVLNINASGFSMDDIFDKPNEIEEKSELPVKQDDEPNFPVAKTDVNAIMACDKKRRELLLTLNRYRTSKRFAKYLSEMKFDLKLEQLATICDDDLEKVLTDIRFCIANKNTNSMVSDGAIQVIGIVENIVSKFYNIKGTSQALSKSESFLEAVEEWNLENAHYTSSSARTRILFELIKTAVISNTIHNHLEDLSKSNPAEFKKIANDVKDLAEKEKECIDKPVPPSFLEKYADLLE